MECAIGFLGLLLDVNAVGLDYGEELWLIQFRNLGNFLVL